MPFPLSISRSSRLFVFGRESSLLCHSWFGFCHSSRGSRRHDWTSRSIAGSSRSWSLFDLSLLCSAPLLCSLLLHLSIHGLSSRSVWLVRKVVNNGPWSQSRPPCFRTTCDHNWFCHSIGCTVCIVSHDVNLGNSSRLLVCFCTLPPSSRQDIPLLLSSQLCKWDQDWIH